MTEPVHDDAPDLEARYGTLRGPVRHDPEPALGVMLDVGAEALREAIANADPSNARLPKARELLDRTLQSAPDDPLKRYRLALLLDHTCKQLASG